MFYRGYTTGTFDLLHEGHIRFLQKAKTMCQVLMVGLTTDELAQQQKRRPILTYAHRRLLLEQLPTVDVVMPHEELGSKKQAYESYKFDVLFIGDDYRNVPEYTNFREAPVIFLPRTPGVSTTELIRHNQLKVMGLGMHGPVVRDWSLVWKFLRVGRPELGDNSGNVYGLAFPWPRNWKRPGVTEEKHPNLVGVNVQREWRIQKFLPAHLNPYETTNVVDCDNKHTPPPDLPREGLAWLKWCRAHPVRLVMLGMKDAGQRLDAMWWRLTVAHRRAVVARIKQITEQLAAAKVVHGDLHAGNIGVQVLGPNLVLTVFDYGWCQHESFDMSPEERAEYSKRLATGWDFTHFERSLAWEFGSDPFRESAQLTIKE